MYKRQYEGGAESSGRINLSAGDRPEPFDWMRAVSLGIQHVVDHVNRAGKKAERQDAKRSIDCELWDVCLAGEDERGKGDEILGPLARPERFEKRAGLCWRSVRRFCRLRLTGGMADGGF